MRPYTAAVATAAAAALVAVSLIGSPAQAVPPLTAAVHAAAVAPAQAEAKRLGSTSGGTYLDRSGHAVIAVTSAAAAGKARAAGYRTHRVRYSFATLTATKDQLDELAAIPNTAWGIDTAHNQVVVTTSTATPAAGAARLRAAAARYGDQIAFRQTTGTFQTYVQDGDAIQNDQARCSAGFNVLQNGQLMVLTAGHCTALGGTWSPMGGDVVASNSPGGDEGLISNPSGDGPSQINTGQAITSIGAPTVGESLSKSGSTTGVTSGTISAVDQTVNFDVGVIYHLFATDVQSDHGDSGGPGYDGSAGLGTLTGGDTQTTYFYPAQLEFSDYGLQLP